MWLLLPTIQQSHVRHKQSDHAYVWGHAEIRVLSVQDVQDGGKVSS